MRFTPSDTFEAKMPLVHHLYHFPVIQSDIFGVFGTVCVVTRIWNTCLRVCACARTVHFNDNGPVGAPWFKRLNPRKRNSVGPLVTNFTFKVAALIHLDKDTCTRTAKACGKVSSEHLQAKLQEGHAEKRAQVVYVNLSSLQEQLTNELPGVFLIDVCS